MRQKKRKAEEGKAADVREHHQDRIQTREEGKYSKKKRKGN